MQPITLVRHPLNFYLLQVISFLIIGGIGFGICLGSFEGINSPDVKRSDYLFFTFGLIFIFLAFYMLIKYIKSAPVIMVNDSTINFANKEVQRISDITEVKLTGKVPFQMLIDFPVEGTVIYFKDGTTKFIFDDFYHNSWELKSFLEQTVVNQKPFEVSAGVTNVPGLDLNYMEVFKGNPVFSFRGIILWGLIGFMTYLTFLGGKPIDPRVTAFFILLSVMLFLGMSNFLNYFGLTDDHLIVKNHHFFWKQHIYKLADIKEIVFETHSKAPNCLRLISSNFKTKLYPAGTLRDKHWLNLMNRLQEKGVIVRNECITVN